MYAGVCAFCGRREAAYLCDCPTDRVIIFDGEKGDGIDVETLTCDRHICADCATQVGRDIHFCPRCMEKLQRMRRSEKRSK